MSLCRITGLVSGVSYRAKNASDVWRLLADGDTLENGESVEVFGHGPNFNFIAGQLQNKVAGVWVNAVALTLDLPEGTSHTRTDVLSITGDATDSTVSVSVTSKKGHLALKRSHLAQLQAEDSRGIRFLWKGNLFAGVVSEISKNQDHGAGGYLSEADARLVANREQFADAGLMLMEGESIVIGPEKFVIAAVGVSDVVYSLELRRNNNA